MPSLEMTSHSCFKSARVNGCAFNHSTGKRNLRPLLPTQMSFIAGIGAELRARCITALKRKSLSLHWEFMYTRSLFQTPDMLAQHHLLNEAADLIDAGVLRGTLRENLGRIDAANLRRAHAQLESGSTIGKLVLAGF